MPENIKNKLMPARKKTKQMHKPIKKRDLPKHWVIIRLLFSRFTENLVDLKNAMPEFVRNNPKFRQFAKAVTNLKNAWGILNEETNNNIANKNGTIDLVDSVNLDSLMDDFNQLLYAVKEPYQIELLREVVKVTKATCQQKPDDLFRLVVFLKSFKEGGVRSENQDEVNEDIQDLRRKVKQEQDVLRKLLSS